MLKRWLAEPTLAVALLSSAIAAFVFEDYLLFRNAYLFTDIGSDTVNHAYPELRHMAQYLRTDGFPGWSFHQGMGQRINSQLLGDPFNLVLILFGSRLAPALGAVEATKIVLCGVAFALYLGVLRVPPYTRIVGGLLYAFCGFTIIGSGWYIFSRQALYLALLFFAFEKYFQDRNWLYLPPVVALIGLSDSFSLVVLALMLCGYVNLRLLDQGAWRPFRALRIATRVGLLAALGIAMSAVLLSSGVLEMVQSPRVAGEVSPLQYLWSKPVLAPNKFSQIASAAARMFSNDLMGTGDHFWGNRNYLEAPAYYCGLATLLLIPQALVLGRPRHRVLCAGLLVLSIGSTFFPWFRYAFWGFTGDYYRAFSLFVSLTLLYPALQALQTIEQSRRPNIPVLLITLATYLGALFYPYSRISLDPEVRLTAFSFLLMETLIIGSMRIEAARRVARPALLLVVCVELAVMSHPAANERSAVTIEELSQRTGYNDHTLEAIAYLKSYDDTFYRVTKDYWSGAPQHPSLNDAKIQNYYGMSSYHSMNSGSYIRFLRAVGAIEPGRELRTRWILGLDPMPVLETFASVKYRLERGPPGSRRDPSQIRRETYRQIGRFGDVNVSENTQFLPLGFTYDAYYPSQLFSALTSDLKQQVLLAAAVVEEDHPGVEVLSELNLDTLPHPFDIDAYRRHVADRRESVLSLTEHGHNLIRGSISLDRPKLLFLSIPFDPGWHARVDELEVVPRRVAFGFTGILLERGEHNIVLEYRIPLLLPSLAISLGALLVYGWLVWSKMRFRTGRWVRFLEISSTGPLSAPPAARR